MLIYLLTLHLQSRMLHQGKNIRQKVLFGAGAFLGKPAGSEVCTMLRLTLPRIVVIIP